MSARRARSGGYNGPVGQSSLLATLSMLAAGCSLIYNPSNIASQKDAPIPIDAPFDANPVALTVDLAFPKMIDEGQGDGNSRPAILVVHGSNILANATVSIASTQAIQVDVDNAHVVVSPASDYLAVPVTAHVDTTLAEATLLPLTITVTQMAGGSPVTKSLTGQVSLVGHDELDASHLPKTDGTALNALYSQVSLAGMAFTFTGGVGQPVLVRAVSSIAIGDITALGKAASGTTGGGAGPGGCSGGNAASAGGCNGGGGAGQSSSALNNGGNGGGAGFSMSGGAGSGASAGSGGAVIGDDMISSYEPGIGQSIPSGGGGGGPGLLTKGGAGGGGGGVVELTAGGDVTAGTITLTGGAGATSGAGGGGGAGGIGMVRSGGTLSVTNILANGGAGAGGGGAGSPGRIRWDAPGGTAPMATPAAVRGPSFIGVPEVITTQAVALQLMGTPSHGFAVYWDDTSNQHTGVPGSFGTDGLATITPGLSVGYNHVCITVMGGAQNTPEADKCVDVAYLPLP